jgi:hypothetical protein
MEEEDLVCQVRLLIEEGGKMLRAANGIIRGLDPDSRTRANVKHGSATHERTPEGLYLADLLQDIIHAVAQTAENVKSKLEGMPQAKKQLDSLWGMLSEPVFQILAGVGLLMAGVLNLVGQLVGVSEWTSRLRSPAAQNQLSGPGSANIVDSLLVDLKASSNVRVWDLKDTQKGKGKNLLGLAC